MHEEKRGLRFPFGAHAEIFLDGSAASISARVMELSLRGCFLGVSSQFKERQQVKIKISNSDERFEAFAEVLYLRPTGVGLIFGDMDPRSRSVLQEWILTALDNQAKAEHS